MKISEDKGPKIALTMDIDWCPDWVLEHCVDFFIDKGIKATFFATHRTSVLEKIRASKLELGIHPNFLPGSSHGDSPDQVLTFCKNLVPEATASRSHSLLTSEPILKLATEEFGIKVDCSVYTPSKSPSLSHQLRYSKHGPSLHRIPHVFQDNMFFFDSSFSWKPEDLTLALKPWTVLNFHPIHVVINSANESSYERIKADIGLSRLVASDLEKYENKTAGAKDLLNQIADSFPSNSFLTISELSRSLILENEEL